jgi:hypothetical protein
MFFLLRLEDHDGRDRGPRVECQATTGGTQEHPDWPRAEGGIEGGGAGHSFSPSLH